MLFSAVTRANRAQDCCTRGTRWPRIYFKQRGLPICWSMSAYVLAETECGSAAGHAPFQVMLPKRPGLCLAHKAWCTTSVMV